MKAKKFISAVLSAALLWSGTLSGIMPFQQADGVANKSRVSVHDPSIFKDENGTYYVFGSHIDAARSRDLQSWTRFTNGYAQTNNVVFGNLSQNLAGAFAWAGEDLEDCEGGFSVWAPDVIYNPDYVNTDGSTGAYMMYFCTSSTYIRSVIAYAVSQNPEGPYTYVDTLIYSGFTSNDSYATSSTKNVNRKYTSTNIDELIASGKVTYNSSWFSGTNFNNDLFPNAIDPTIYYEPDGTMYMCYGSWSGGIFTIEIDSKTGKCIHPKTGTTSDGRLVDSYFGTKISGGSRKSGEGPFIEYNADTGYYYLWVTYGGLAAAGGYNMRVFRSKNPDGPYYDPAGNPAVLSSNSNLDSVGLKVMGNYKFSSLSTAYMACGHNSVLMDDDGRWYLINHVRFNTGNEYHEVRVHSMYFNSQGWPVVAPYEYSGDVISEGGYDETHIIGSYDYINHGNDTSSTIHEYSSIILNADGTISGSVSGTWSQAQDSAAATLVIGGNVYYGYFLAAQDETGQEKKVMSFTAVGSNNQTIWGAQTKEYTATDREVLIDYTNISSKLVYNPDSAESSEGHMTVCDTTLLSGVSYYITNKNSGKVLDLADGNTAYGTNIQQWTKTGGSQQEWRIVALENEYCKIVSMADEGKCIAVAENSSANGVNIELAAYTGGDNQQWKIIKDGVYYAIVSKCSGDAAGMDIYDWSTENGGNLNQWEYWGGDCQLWAISPVYPAVNDERYTIKNVNSSKWLTVERGGNVIQNGTAKVWQIIKLADATYCIMDDDGIALTVESGTGDNGKSIYASEYTGTASQKFIIQCNKDGSYSILTAVSGGFSCLDVYETSTESGANICQWEYWGGDNQKFVIEPAGEETSDYILGDINHDNIVNVVDVALAKHGLTEGFADKAAELAADTDGNGIIDENDVLRIQDFVLAKSQNIN